jgi:hypothetical protein
MQQDIRILYQDTGDIRGRLEGLREEMIARLAQHDTRFDRVEVALGELRGKAAAHEVTLQRTEQEMRQLRELMENVFGLLKDALKGPPALAFAAARRRGEA